MKKMYAVAAMIALFGLAGCASPPQQPIAMSGTVLQNNSARIGVAMAPLPKVDTWFPGASCLLCLAAASATNSSLTTYTQTLPVDDVAHIKTDVADALRKKGYNAVVLPDDLKVRDLPKGSEGPNKPKYDFSSLASKYQIDKLVVIEIGSLGVRRNYSSYIPNGDPQAALAGTGYLVNLSNNTYEWYLPLDQVKGAAGSWDEPPKYPGLTNAYFQVVEGTRDAVLKPFAN
jgi:hypothetical protein